MNTCSAEWWPEIRAFLFLPVVYGLFYRNLGSWALWVAVTLVVVDFGVALLDVLEENQSWASRAASPRRTMPSTCSP
ncbi:MAG: hypothetical protein K1Y36_22915 [Blastocatellia bacterium]|nr:hypothetical protein [Blastocatellia bacterium]